MGKLVSIGEKVVKDHGKAMIALDLTYFGIYCDSAKVVWQGRLGLSHREAAIEVLGWMRKQMESGVGMVPERAWIFDPLFFNSAVW